MDSQIKQRTTSASAPDNTTATMANKSAARGGRREKRMAMAKRGLRSLAVAVGLPLSLTFLSIYFLDRGGGYGRGSGEGGRHVAAFWFPPLWLVHATCLTAALLMGLSGWLVWAEGGFHKQPAALYTYGAQLGLSLVWGPVVFGLGAPSLGLVVCVGVLGALAGCYRHFRGINPIAADLVKPCFAWAAFLAVLNLKLVSSCEKDQLI
ncbi:unnamed protein product [Linum tenue]|uniref:Translocator protein homolog n=1 Tax=Linum tenue TaxID=586396 RepID=A0AAV0PFV7_9ROSI|nr:unnamed protein product [Linum tenue]